MLGVDGINGAIERRFQKVPEQGAADASLLLGSANDRNASGMKKRIERGAP